MKKNLNYIFYIFIISVFIGINILVYFIINSQKRHDSLYVQYVAETAISEIIAAIKDDRLDDFFDLNDEILGFGIYDSTGNPLLRYGKTPDKLEDNFANAGYFKINDLQNTIEFLRPFGMMSFGMMHHGMTPPQRRGPMSGLQFIYLEMKAGTFISNGGRMPILLFVIFSLILSAIMILVIFLYKKNDRYKELHERQMQLVQLGEASRTIAHEIKNPLSSIKIQTALLRHTLNEDGKREIDIIDEESDRIKNISDKVRDFLGDPAGNPENVDPDEFIRNMIIRYARDISYENMIEEKICINIDPERMRSILENVVNNALESSEDDKPVRIILRSEKNTALISVIDEGKGISKKDLKSVFDPFFTTKIHGLGLGLSLVKKYVEAANGSIDIFSNEGGTTVLLHFKTDMRSI